MFVRGLSVSVIVILCLLVLQKPAVALDDVDSQGNLDLGEESVASLIAAGDELSQAGDHEAALQKFLRVIELMPELYSGHHFAGDELSKLKKYGEAIDCYEEALRLVEEDDEWLFLLYYSYGQALYQLDRIEEATVAYQESARLDPEFSPSQYKSARMLWLADKPVEALTAVKTAIELNPDHNPTIYLHGEILSDLERWEEALAAYARSEELGKTGHWVAYDQGRCLEKLGRTEDAAQKYLIAIERNPENDLAWGHLGYCYLETGEYQQAAEALGRAMEIDPEYLAWTSNTAYAQYNLEQYDTALELYSRAVDLGGDSIGVWQHFGKCALHQGEYRTALTAFDRAIELEPDIWAVRYEYGLALFLNKRFSKAQAVFSKLTEDFPDEPRGWSQLAIIESRLGSPDLAVEWAQYAIELGVDPVLGQSALAIAYIQQGSYLAAKFAAEELLGLNDADHIAFAVLGIASYSESDFDSALEYFRSYVDSAVSDGILTEKVLLYLEQLGAQDLINELVAKTGAEIKSANPSWLEQFRGLFTGE